MNGIEVAVKAPKMKVSLNPRDLKNFEKEAAIQAKVRIEHRGAPDQIQFLPHSSSGPPSSRRAHHRSKLDPC